VTAAAVLEPGGWEHAVRAAAAFAVDPAGLGGVVLRALPGPVRSRWLALVEGLLPESVPWRHVPVHVADERLLGGLDLAATLAAGRPVRERGLLVEADGGVAVAAMAERMTSSQAARWAAVLDTREVVLERDGLASRDSTRFGVIAVDEGVEDDEEPPAALAERLALRLDLAAIAPRDAVGVFAPERVAAARERLPRVVAPVAVVETLCATAAALGIDSIRAPWLALRAACAAAALEGRDEVDEADVFDAVAWVLAPRARCLPPCEAEAPEEDAEAPPEPEPEAESDAAPDPGDRTDEDRVLEAAAAAIPPRLLEQLRAAGGPRIERGALGRAGALTGAGRGRPCGVRRGRPGGGARLDLPATLRAAAPWQRLRRRERAGGPVAARRIEVRRDDLRITRLRHRSETCAIFAVDASGSTVLQRLAEAKGAVELLLAECYVRRDRVALVAFRGERAELVLPPTRSLVRAKRALAALAGGGGTPLASGIDLALELALGVQRRGSTPLVVVLTDGRANVDRRGRPGRGRADADATEAARRLRSAGIPGLLVDTSPRPRPAAERLAAELAARYLPLPHASSRALCAAVQDAAAELPAAEARVG